MKLRNKKTGEIYELNEFCLYNEQGYAIRPFLSSLTELNEEWEDAPEEPKKHYEILGMGVVIERKDAEDEIFRNQGQREIGNRFETEEEAEKAVEKLKAITRLSKCGFRFEGYDNRDRANGGDIVIYAHVDTPHNNLIEDAQPAMLKDLDLLFCTEEDS